LTCVFSSATDNRNYFVAVLLAEVVHHYYPKLVQLHNYRHVERAGWGKSKPCPTITPSCLEAWCNSFSVIHSIFIGCTSFSVYVSMTCTA